MPTMAGRSERTGGRGTRIVKKLSSAPQKRGPHLGGKFMCCVERERSVSCVWGGQRKIESRKLMLEVCKSYLGGFLPPLATQFCWFALWYSAGDPPLQFVARVYWCVEYVFPPAQPTGMHIVFPSGVALCRSVQYRSLVVPHGRLRCSNYSFVEPRMGWKFGPKDLPRLLKLRLVIACKWRIGFVIFVVFLGIKNLQLMIVHE